ASNDDTEMVDVLLSNPSTVSPLGSASPVLLVSPNKSRTVLLYSVRVRRRIGAGPELGIEHPAGPELSGLVMTPSQLKRDTAKATGRRLHMAGLLFQAPCLPCHRVFSIGWSSKGGTNRPGLERPSPASSHSSAPRQTPCWSIRIEQWRSWLRSRCYSARSAWKGRRVVPRTLPLRPISPRCCEPRASHTSPIWMRRRRGCASNFTARMAPCCRVACFQYWRHASGWPRLSILTPAIP